MAPRVPALRKAVAQHHERPLTHLGEMQIDAVRLHGPMRDAAGGRCIDRIGLTASPASAPSPACGRHLAKNNPTSRRDLQERGYNGESHICKIISLAALTLAAITSALGDATETIDAKSAVEFVLSTCLPTMDDVANLEAMAREKNWFPLPRVPSNSPHVTQRLPRADPSAEVGPTPGTSPADDGSTSTLTGTENAPIQIPSQEIIE
jgi:hypothetical protein